MSYLESSSWCKRHEYETNKSNRIMPASLYIDELYTLMLAVRNSDAKRQAARKPAKVIKIEETESGLHQVTFAVLNDDLQVEAQTFGKLPDGMWADAAGKLRVGSPDEWHPVIGGYFKNAEGGLDDEWQRFAAGLEIGELALAGASS